MRIIPVVDLQGGLVVRGIGGQRDRYRPVTGALTGGPDVASAAEALVEGFGFAEVYVADLDAIGGGEPRWDLYEILLRAGLRLTIDGGLSTVDRTSAFRDFGRCRPEVTGIIVALETLRTEDSLADIFRVLGRELAVFSLDLKDGRPLTSVTPWRGLAPERLMAVAVDIGFRRGIVLDLARVGRGRGTGLDDLCRRLRFGHSGLELVAGGGVRDRRDLDALASAGCDAALVGSALGDGQLTATDVQDYVS
jgi:phosphoribosylformimino-5-aminoimidazole carboxamide ribotide isomerase